MTRRQNLAAAAGALALAVGATLAAPALAGMGQMPMTGGHCDGGEMHVDDAEMHAEMQQACERMMGGRQ